MKIARQNESCEERESRLSQVRKNIADSRAREKSPVREMRLLHQQIQTFNQRQRESLNDYKGLRISVFVPCVIGMLLRLRAAFQYHAHLDYINSTHVQIGSMDKSCTHCNAKKWKD